MSLYHLLFLFHSSSWWFYFFPTVLYTCTNTALGSVVIRTQAMSVEIFTVIETSGNSASYINFSPISLQLNFRWLKYMRVTISYILPHPIQENTAISRNWSFPNFLCALGFITFLDWDCKHKYRTHCEMILLPWPFNMLLLCSHWKCSQLNWLERQSRTNHTVTSHNAGESAGCMHHVH